MEITDELGTPLAADLVLNRYRLGQRLGAGGFGTVYAATDERLQRPVAVKVIPSGGGDPTRAQREALAAGRLDHPGIVAIFDAGQDDQARYLVSELVYGRTVDDLNAEGLLSDRDVLAIGRALCGALAHAHERGVVHRDVKPQNVLIPEAPRSAAGVAKLADFGVAHLAGDEPLTRTGDVVGTLAYMAPEQAEGKRIDHRCDLYSLALVLYEALAGVHPVRAGSPAATAKRVGTVLPPLKRHRKDLPPELCAAIDRAVRPKPGERGTLEDLAAALEDALPEVSDEGGTVATWEGGHDVPRGLDRALAAVAAGGLCAAALAWAEQPALPALAAVLAVALLPRLGWLATAVATVAAVSVEHPGAALLIGFALAPVPLLLRRHGPLWSVPALAPLLGLATLAGVFPALAGQARGWFARAALGALGAWWALLAAPLLGRAMLLAGEGTGGARAVAGADEPAAALAVASGDPALVRGANVDEAVDLVLRPLAESGVLLYALVWAAAAAVLPWLVRGRFLALDLVAASAWAAALGGATVAAADAIGVAEPRHAVLASVFAGAFAVTIPHLRRAPVVEP
ncbi:serine/threonine protein kinase [Solirubrobacter sp. CPCC 204708]|uniref:non-specific serine/threonine protein kinase n=1 Tax=Solirubrobacter deserti TaxID=2282478 RepID=A0ABT4RMK2_9ACTN|nr:serine/threonine-protein kinase [Solirubrobacter deserti]MBE2316966.1 serine/threonine protein kinase [Solirubrobacter deserti]MDA0139797.1 serine/threonine protein kinase [Solirubrobacter deserti]